MANNQLPVVGLDQVMDPEAYRELAVQAVFGVSLDDLVSSVKDESDPS